jgi:hypothetical protein
MKLKRERVNLSPLYFTEVETGRGLKLGYLRLASFTQNAAQVGVTGGEGRAGGNWFFSGLGGQGQGLGKGCLRLASFTRAHSLGLTVIMCLPCVRCTWVCTATHTKPVTVALNTCVPFLCASLPQEMHSALNQLERAGCNGYVLDLRDNPGGLVQAGLDVARLWMDGAPDVFLVSGREDEPVQRVSASCDWSRGGGGGGDVSAGWCWCKRISLCSG